MDNRLGNFLLKRTALASLLISGLLATNAVQAQDAPVQVIEPDIERRTITEADIDSENFEVGLFVGIIGIEDFGNNAVYGTRAAWHFTEDLFAEISIGLSEGNETSYEELSGGSPLFSDDDRQYQYYDLSIGWNVLPGEIFFGGSRSHNSALYLIAGLGNTQFLDDSWLTFTVGAGFRLLINDWLAWHIDARDHIFDRDSLGIEETTHNLEFSTGVSVFF